jgi:hypothetical protein
MHGFAPWPSSLVDAVEWLAGRFGPDRFGNLIICYPDNYLERRGDAGLLRQLGPAIGDFR